MTIMTFKNIIKDLHIKIDMLELRQAVNQLPPTSELAILATQLIEQHEKRIWKECKNTHIQKPSRKLPE